MGQGCVWFGVIVFVVAVVGEVSCPRTCAVPSRYNRPRTFCGGRAAMCALVSSGDFARVACCMDLPGVSLL